MPRNALNDRLVALFEAAVALESESARSEFLSRECPDPELRRELESLLACHEDPDPIFGKGPAGAKPADNSKGDNHQQFLGQTLDEKYRLERLLGQGGMGAVYLSTHLGTGRDVAVKLITPRFMRNQEFVERFKREARAAGRLRHPNIVDVTDFGVARVDSERVAYLVMEYLDGCTLSDVLLEETRLPLPWVVDILEQVCSAVHQAHQQGIIHRDLKPANIWLEPNTLGGYRVKVLDFGIAKLADTRELPLEPSADSVSQPEARIPRLPQTSNTPIGSDGDKTQLTESPAPMERTLASPTEALTRVGAILGTPSHMSPEQCRGKALDARADIYALGIIAYQMLSGSPPFTGEAGDVLRAHQVSEPAPLYRRAPGMPRSVSHLIMSALQKDPNARPKTAMAFAHALRARTEELGALYRRAFALYSEYFPKVVKLSLLAHIPVLMATLLTIGLALAEPRVGTDLGVAFEISSGWLKGAASFVTGSAISGVIAIIVTHLAVVPLKPVTLSAAFAILRKRWRPLFRTGLLAILHIVVGFIMLVIPGLVLMVRYSLWAPVVLMEGLENRSALRRSRDLAARSWGTCVLATFFQVLVPALAQVALNKLISPETGGNHGFQAKVISELTTLGSIVVLPLVSIVLALAYLKMRQLGGEGLVEVLAQIEERGSRPRWEQRMRARLQDKPSST